MTEIETVAKNTAFLSVGELVTRALSFLLVVGIARYLGDIGLGAFAFAFAFMDIPAEAIYYDLLVNEVGSIKVNTRNLIDYAYNEKKVIIVSPTTFAAYLQSVLYGFKAFKIEETYKEIAKNADTLSRHLKAYEDYYKRLGASLSTTVNHYNAGSKELGKIDKDIYKITGASPELDSPELEKPQTE